MSSNKSVTLPPIPDKRYFTIGEASDLCAVKTHVLRYWEQEFSQLKPIKRRGNRRYYQAKDIELVRRIRALLYAQGYTISGAKRELTHPSSAAPQVTATVAEKPAETTTSTQAIEFVTRLREGLESLLEDIK